MFKLGAFTDEISQDLAHACKVCREFGVVGAELRGIGGAGIHTLTDSRIREVRTILDDHGMAVCSIASPFGKCELDDAGEVAQHMDILRRCGDVGRELGCRLIRGFAFWGHDAVGERPWDRMLAAFDPVPAILEEKDVVLGLENEAACYVGTAAHTRTFLDRLACPRVKAVWDPANHIQDRNGDDMAPFPDGYELIKKDIVHVHVKDAVVEPGGHRPNVFLGMGGARWERQFEALLRDGYTGYVSLETHVNLDRFPEAWQARYGAYRVGQDGQGREGASKVCLAWMRDRLAEMA